MTQLILGMYHDGKVPSEVSEMSGRVVLDKMCEQEILKKDDLPQASKEFDSNDWLNVLYLHWDTLGGKLKTVTDLMDESKFDASFESLCVQYRK